MYKKFLVYESASLEETLRLILSNSRRTVMVLAKNKKIMGTISEGDILRSKLEKKNLSAPACAVMNKSFKYLINKKDIKVAKKIFIKFNINILPVLNKNFHLLSVITLDDLLNDK